MVACARGVPDVTILTGGVDVVAGTAHITADEAERHEAAPKVLLRGNVVALELFLWLAAMIGALTS